MTLGLSVEEIKERNLVNQKKWRLDNQDKVKINQNRYNDKGHVKSRKLLWSCANKDLINARKRARYHIKMHAETE